MLGRKIHICQRLFHAVADLFCCFLQLHVSELPGNSFCFFSGSFLILLGMNCLKHQRHIPDFCSRHSRKHIAIEVNNAAVISDFREDFTSLFEHARTFVANYEPDTLQPADAQPLEEFLPAFLVFLQTFGCAKNLTISVFIHCNSHKNGYILIFTAPVPFQIDAIHIHIGILPALKRTVPPLLDMFVCLLVQCADRGGRNLLICQNGISDMEYLTFAAAAPTCRKRSWISRFVQWFPTPNHSDLSLLYCVSYVRSQNNIMDFWPFSGIPMDSHQRASRKSARNILGFYIRPFRRSHRFSISDPSLTVWLH